MFLHLASDGSIARSQNIAKYESQKFANEVQKGEDELEESR